MVDLETTGVDPGHNAIIQIAAVRWNYKTREIGPAFVACLDVPENRFWDQSTLAWWQNQGDVLDRILGAARPALETWLSFVDWVIGTTPSLEDNRLWAKPISFEWPYLQSYGRQYGAALPIHYRNAIDLNSFTRGMADDPSRGPLDKQIPFVGDQHDALDDCNHQIIVALQAKEILCSVS